MIHSSTTTTFALVFFVWTIATTILPSSVAAFRYQVDTDADCAEKLNQCTTSDTVWFVCPISCHEPLFEEGSMFEVHDDPEQFFSEMTVTRYHGEATAKSSVEMSLEDFEGYVTIFAVVPLFPGMAQFYYELLEHVQTVYPYTVQTLIQPYDINKNNESSSSSSSSSTNDSQNKMIIPHDIPKTILLEPTNRPTQVLDYLLHVPQVAGNPNIAFHTDRVTIWLISADGMFIERLNSPAVSLLERRVAVFLKQLEWSPDL